MNDTWVTNTDGAYNVSFKIYDDPTAGSLLWNEEMDVNFTNGIATVILHGVNADFSDPLYLGYTVGNDSEHSPRTNLTSVPSALYCNYWDSLDTPLDFSQIIVADNGSFGTTPSTTAGVHLTVNNSLMVYNPSGTAQWRCNVLGGSYCQFTSTDGMRFQAGSGDHIMFNRNTPTTSDLNFNDGAGYYDASESEWSFFKGGINLTDDGNISVANRLTAEDIFVNNNVNVTSTIYSEYAFIDSAVCSGYSGASCSYSQFPLDLKSKDLSGRMIKMTENSGSEYQQIWVDSAGDTNWYADSSSIRIAILDNVARLIVGATTGANTLSVNGNLGVGGYYNTACPTGGICSSGYNSFGTANFVNSFVQTMSFSGKSVLVASATKTVDDKGYTYYTNYTGNTTITLVDCGEKKANDRIYNFKYFDGDDTTSNVTIQPFVGQFLEGVVNGQLKLEQVGDAVTVQCLAGTRDYGEYGWAIIGSYNSGDYTVT